MRSCRRTSRPLFTIHQPTSPWQPPNVNSTPSRAASGDVMYPRAAKYVHGTANANPSTRPHMRCAYLHQNPNRFRRGRLFAWVCFGDALGVGRRVDGWPFFTPGLCLRGLLQHRNLEQSIIRTRTLFFQPPQSVMYTTAELIEHCSVMKRPISVMGQERIVASVLEGADSNTSGSPFIALQTLNEPAPFHRPFRFQPTIVSQSSPDPPSARAEYGRPKKRRGVLEVVNEFEVVHGHALVHRTVLG